MIFYVNQLRYFISLASLGVLSGFLYDFLFVIVYFWKNKIKDIIRDFVFFIMLCIPYVIVSVKLNLPNTRLYMGVAVFVGFILYIKRIYKHSQC